MRYQNVGKALPVIAEELGVDAVVEGSVLRAGDRVRITAQLVHAPSDSHLWADYYEGDLSDIMRLQSDTARAIAREIKAVLTPEEEARMLHERRVDPEAYEAYLKGRFHLNKRNREGVTTALSYFQKAVGLDPTDALAHADLADTYTVLGWYNWERPSEAFPKAKIAAMQALALDETLAEAHTSLAAVLMNYEWDWAAAEGRFKRAIELNPGYPTAHHWYALLLVWTGRSDEAIAEIARSRSLDPLSLIINTVVGYVDYHARRFEKAARQIDRVLEMDPDFLFAHKIGLMIDLQRGRFEEAGVAAQRAIELTDGALDEQAHVIEVHALAGRRERAIELFADLKKSPQWEEMSAEGMATIYLALGDHDSAIEALEKAYDERSWLVTTLGTDAQYDPIRNDPRFQDLLRRVGLPPD
jgi:tetratricopeptide (TPR) repeat protein